MMLWGLPRVTVSRQQIQVPHARSTARERRVSADRVAARFAVRLEPTTIPAPAGRLERRRRGRANDAHETIGSAQSRDRSPPVAQRTPEPPAREVPDVRHPVQRPILGEGVIQIAPSFTAEIMPTAIVTLSTAGPVTMRCALVSGIGSEHLIVEDRVSLWAISVSGFVFP
jgi:hypothetical protein